MKKTKIVCTLGPASNNEGVLKEMLSNGMNVARFNFSHGSHEEHKSRMDLFRKCREEVGVTAALLLDTKGPEIRLREFENGSVVLKTNDTFTLTNRDIIGNESIVSMTYTTLPQEVFPGCVILIDDGKVFLEVISSDNVSDVLCKVTNGGKISNKKGVNIPEIHLNLPVLSDNDKKDLIFGISQDVDFVAASFVRNKEDVIEIREFLKENNGDFIKIISKIENPEGVENFDEILEYSDGIMVARGDLGVEVPSEQLPGIQKQFISKCNKAGKIVITATQMLDSMISNPTPTRAEITDVANAIFDGTSAIMLSGESANGLYPAQAVKMMKKIAIKAESDAVEFGYYRVKGENCCECSCGAIAWAAKEISEDIKSDSIVCYTEDGKLANCISKFRPEAIITAVTTSKKVRDQLILVRGVYPVLVKNFDEYKVEEGNNTVVACCKTVKIVK